MLAIATIRIEIMSMVALEGKQMAVDLSIAKAQVSFHAWRTQVLADSCEKRLALHLMDAFSREL